MQGKSRERVTMTTNKGSTSSNPSPGTQFPDQSARECKAYITSFLGVYPSWHADPEEPMYTTWQSVYLVLFAAAFLQNRSPELLCEATGFSITFADITVRVTNIDDFWKSEAFIDLSHTLQSRRDNLVEVHNSLEYLQDSLKRLADPQISRWLHTARAGVLFGGSQETPGQYSGAEERLNDKLLI
jgi:hypothetical protein